MGWDRSRVIGFIDMDSFEVQIYLKNISKYFKWIRFYKTLPMILADGERIVSVNSVSKRMGISRQITVTDAFQICPDILKMEKTKRYNKPESFLLRRSSLAVLDAIIACRKSIIGKRGIEIPLEYSPSDEFYLDLTAEVDYRGRNSHIFKFPRSIFNLEITKNQYLDVDMEFLDNRFNLRSQDQNVRYLRGLAIMEEMSDAIFSKTGFECSIGVSENKLLAKFACNLYKPNGKTVMTHSAFYYQISKTCTIDKLKGLGGDLGDLINQCLNQGDPMIIGHLRCYGPDDLQIQLGIDQVDARFIFERVRGMCTDPVNEKLMTNSITVAKSNYRKPYLFVQDFGSVKEALDDLCLELLERLREDMIRHERFASSIQVHFWIADGSKGFFTVELPYCEVFRHRIIGWKLIQDTFTGFQNKFIGWIGKVEKISLTARPKLNTSEKCVTYHDAEFWK